MFTGKRYKNILFGLLCSSVQLMQRGCRNHSEKAGGSCFYTVVSTVGTVHNGVYMLHQSEALTSNIKTFINFLLVPVFD